MRSFQVNYEHFRKNWTIVEEFRQRSSIHKHILSLPYQWAKRYNSKQVLKSLDKQSDYPSLRDVGDQRIVVSLTSFPYRIPKLHLVIKSLLGQKILPGKIVLWLTAEEFPAGMEELPDELKQMMPYGLEIVFVPEVLRSHDKYYHAFKQYPDKIIVTVDDDIVYSPWTLEHLMDLHAIFPRAVCGSHIRKIRFGNDGDYLPYSQWERPLLEFDAKSFDFIAIGYGGVLYPAGIYDDMVLDDTTFLRLTPMADDLWLKATQLKQGIKVASGAGFFVKSITIPGSQKVSLRKFNDRLKQNDVQWQNLDRHFELKQKFNAILR